MSTFPGNIEEIPGISIDRFDNENLKSKVFFLSHCHIDHMRGLGSKVFEEMLKKEDKFIYLSPISKAILRRMYPGLVSRLKELHLEGNTSILVSDEVMVSVTIIPAGHCPGSVMFLFGTSDGKQILYTGDYRIKTSDIPKFKSFYDTFNQIKKIDAVYLDTTFFLEYYKSFPSRDESLQEICKIINEWLSQNNRNCIKLDTCARYGYEYLFKEIYEKLKMPVHVNDEVFTFYSLIPELDDTVTKNGEITRIHSCYFGYKRPCDNIDYQHVKNIKISAFRWKNDDLQHGLTYFENGIHYVCYSTHASFEEGVALLNLLRPKKIVPCVEHQDDAVATLKMKKLIQNKVDEFNKVETVETSTDFGPTLFNIEENVKSPKKKKKRKVVDPEFIQFLDSFS